MHWEAQISLLGFATYGLQCQLCSMMWARAQLVAWGVQDQEEASTSAGASNGAGGSGSFQQAEVGAVH